MTRTHLLAAAIAGVLSFPLHANAQDTNPAPGTPVTDLTKVTVSASTSRLPDSDAALPNTITVITAEELREQLAVTRDLSQVLANLIPAFAPSRQKMSSFGESLRGRQPLYMVDGVPQSTPLRDGSRDAHTIDPAMIERIEVIHGANALQGLGASGGIINIITRRAPRKDGSFHELTVGASTALPHRDDSAGYRGSYLFGTRKGAFDFVGGLSYAQEGLYYDGEGDAHYGTAPKTYTLAQGEVHEEYDYDDQNRLTSVLRDGMQVDARWYDAADRVVRSGPRNLPTAYTELLNEGVPASQSTGLEMRINRYDANGRLLHQRVKKSGGRVKMEIAWSNETLADGTVMAPKGYDQVGNVAGYAVWQAEGGVLNTYETSFKYFDSYQADTTSGKSSELDPATLTQKYDVNGFLVAVTDSGDAAKNRTFVNDAAGRTLYVEQEGHAQRQLIVNGEVLGIYGVTVDTTTSVFGSHPTSDFADFNFGYSPITANYPNPSPGAYQVRTGETLQGIAQAAYGDSSLWYRIAEANGLESNDDLRVGQTLTIPNRVGTISNNNTTFKPYDPSRIQGDMTPTLGAPEGKDGCGGFGQVLMVVVAVVVTFYTIGTLTAQTLAAETALLGGTETLALTATEAISWGAQLAAGGFVSVPTAMVGAAAGSAAGQLVGLATGDVQKFSWRQVGVSAISAGTTAAIAPTLLGKDLPALVGRSMLANVLAQGISVAVGMQERFNWRAVAATGMGAAAGAVAAEALHMNEPQFATAGPGEQLAKRLASGLAAGTTAALARGGRVEVQQVATDAFGNALGGSLAESASSAPIPTAQAGSDDPLGAFIGLNDGWSGVSAAPTFAEDVAMRTAGRNPMGLPTRSQMAGEGAASYPGFMESPEPWPERTGPRTYTVRAGDNPANIGRAFYGDERAGAAILAASGLSPSVRGARNLQVGQVLTLPEDISSAALRAGGGLIDSDADIRMQEAAAKAYALRMSGGPRGGTGVAYGDAPMGSVSSISQSSGVTALDAAKASIGIEKELQSLMRTQPNSPEAWVARRNSLDEISARYQATMQAGGLQPDHVLLTTMGFQRSIASYQLDRDISQLAATSVASGVILGMQNVPGAAGARTVTQNNLVGNSFDQYVTGTKLKGLDERGLLTRQEHLPTPDIAGKNYVKPDYSIRNYDGRVVVFAEAKSGAEIPFDAQARGLITWSRETPTKTLIYYTPDGTTPISPHLLNYARQQGVRIKQVGVP